MSRHKRQQPAALFLCHNSYHVDKNCRCCLVIPPFGKVMPIEIENNCAMVRIPAFECQNIADREAKQRLVDEPLTFEEH